MHLLAKCPLAKCPVGKCPLAKCPLAKWALPKCLDTVMIKYWVGFNFILPESMSVKLSHTNFATLSLMMRFLSLVVSRLTNFSSLVSLAISLMVDSALVKGSSLRRAFEVHSVRKWNYIGCSSGSRD